jgi:hypothetical protein
MTAASPRPRRIAPPSWLDLRLVLGVALVLASITVGALVVSRAGDTQPAVAVTRDLAAGTVLTADDLAIRQVRLPAGGGDVYLAGLHDALHRELTRAVSAGELLPAAAVHPVPVRTTLTVPLDAESAPDLRAGQRIEVWVSTAACPSSVLLAGVTVQAVHVDGGGSFGTGAGGQDVVISVDRSLAERVVGALAIDGAQLRAGILAGPADGPTDDAAPHAALPDLGPCARPSAGR